MSKMYFQEIACQVYLPAIITCNGIPDGLNLGFHRGEVVEKGSGTARFKSSYCHKFCLITLGRSFCFNLINLRIIAKMELGKKERIIYAAQAEEGLSREY